MHSWCALSNEQLVPQGSFGEARLEALSGQPIHLESDFLEALADRIMDRYESRRSARMLVIKRRQPEPPTRTKRFYRRLFDQNGEPTEDFRSWAAEVLAAWIEESLDGSIFSHAGSTHNTDPAFDIVSIVKDQSSLYHLRLVQAKATPNNLQGNCAEAIRKFAKLEKGDYAAELLARLEMLEARKDFPTGIDVAELMFDPEKRYRVTALHGEDRRGILIMTAFDKSIQGDQVRRSARLIHIAWPMFWAALGGRVYARLA